MKIIFKISILSIGFLLLNVLHIYSQAPTNGLVAYYPFNGNPNDATGNNRNGTISGGVTPTTDRFGVANQAYAFNGSNGYINVANWNTLTGNAPRTMMVWFKTVVPNTSQYFLSWGSYVNSANSALLMYVPGIRYLGFGGWSNDIWVQDQFQYYDSQWHQIALAFDGSNMSLYLNGILVNSKITTLNTGSSNLFIGNRSGSEFFNGLLDDIRIYNRALTGTEIQQTYLAEAPTTSTAEVVKLGADRFLSTIGSASTYLGVRSGFQANSSLTANTFTGFETGKNNTGSFNVFNGAWAGQSNTTGNANVFMGASAGQDNTTGASNTFAGNSAGRFNLSGAENVFLGYDAGWKANGNNNVIIGKGAGGWATTGNNNVYVGWQAGLGSQTNPNTGVYNTFVGFSSGNKNTSGKENTFTGTNSGFNNTTGSRNTVYGYNSGSNLQTANDNVFMGWFSGHSITGSEVVAIGRGAGTWATTVSGSVFLGKDAGEGSETAANTGVSNTFLGTEAGNKNTSGSYNVFSGFKSGVINSTGSHNVFTGNQSGFKNTTGLNNTFSGSFSGFNLETGVNNSLFGAYAGYGMLGDNNVAVGVNAGQYSTTGSRNTYLGTNAGRGSSTLANTGIKNTYIGFETGLTNTTGLENTFLGYRAGNNNTTGSGNLYLGAQADGFGSNGSGLQYAVAIGYNAQVSGSNKIVLGDTSNVNMGVGIGTTNPSTRLEVRAQNPNQSGIRTTNLTSNSPTQLGNNKALSVNNFGDLILVPMISGSGTNTHSDSAWVRVSANTNFIGGNIGIGVPLPQFKLDVGGVVNIRGINGNQLFKLGGVNFLKGYKNFNSAIGFQSEVDSNVYHATAIGYNAYASASNVLVLGGVKENAVNVGIGNTAPQDKLEVTSDQEGTSGLMFTNLTKNSITLSSSNKFLSVDEKGKVGLYHFFADQITLKISNPDQWSDKVFASNYQLLSIEKVESFIKKEGHLPNIPSAKEMTEKGISTQEMFAKLLEKQEELMLYLLEQNKLIIQQAKEIEDLKKKFKN